MNAPNSLPQDDSAEERKAYEPSMEEILASIRQIIADDQSAMTRLTAPPKEETGPPAEPLVIAPAGDAAGGWIDSSAAPGGEPAVQAPPVTARVGSPAAGAAPEIILAAMSESFAVAPGRNVIAAIERPEAEDALVSPATDAAVSTAFSALVASRFLPSNDRLGEMIREMIRPMLKTWLDDNLPILVERLVRAEIERVARGGR
jgi:uncharacterized protein